MEAFLQLVGTLFATSCGLNPRSLYGDNYGPFLKNGDVFDFIVVGAGSAGAVVASRLAENPAWKVLLVEAGGYPTVDTEIPLNALSLMRTDLDWQYESQPSPSACLGFEGNRCRWARGKVLGGSSTINSMLYTRGTPSVYNDWAAMGNPGWAWRDVLKYFKKFERVVNSNRVDYGREGPLTITYNDRPLGIQEIIMQAASEAGIPRSQNEAVSGFCYIPLSTKDGRRDSTAKAYLRRDSLRRNLYIAVETLVTKLIIRNKVVVGVVVETNGKRVGVKVRHEVVLSAGTVNTPQILMVSGIGPKKHLAQRGISVVKDLPVGENLQDHLINYGLYVKLTPQPAPDLCSDVLGYCLYKNGSFSLNNIQDQMWFFSTTGDDYRPNVQIQLLHVSPSEIWQIAAFIDAVGLDPVIAESVYADSTDNSLLFICTTLVAPKSRGRILLNTNPVDKPLIYPEYLTHPDDINAAIASLDEIRKLINTPTFKSLNATITYPNVPNCKHLEVGTRDYDECHFRNTMNTDFHATGTCKMGPVGDPTSVVDPRLRVIGVKQLRVIDASIMPIINNRNTNAPSIMIGEKGADLIKEDHGFIGSVC